jgi:hypothetical protein
LLNQDLTANGGRNVILGRLLTSIDLLNHLASEVKHILKEAHSPDKSIKSRIPLMEIAVQFSAEAREHNKDIGKITEQFGPAQPRRPMNAPPQMAVQINVPGQSPQVHIK